MAVQVGGIFVNFKVNTEEAEGALNRFIKKMSDIRLEGAIKGNPFKATSDYMKAARKQLNEVFSEWAKNIHDFTPALDTLEEKARENVEGIIKEFQRVTDELASWDKKVKGASKVLSFGKGGAGRGIDFESAAGVDIDKFKKDLNKLKGISDTVDILLKDLIDKVANGKITTEVELTDYFEKIKLAVEQAEPEIASDYKKFGETIAKGLNLQKSLEAGVDLRQAKDRRVAIKERVALTKELIIKEAELLKNAQAGIGTSQLQVNLIKLYNKYKEKGAFLDGSRKEALAQYTLEEERSRLSAENLEKKEKELGLTLKELAKTRKQAATEATRAEAERLKEKARLQAEEVKKEKKIQADLTRVQEEADKERAKADAERLKAWEALIKKQEAFAKRRAATLYGTSEQPRELPRLASATSQVFKRQAELMLTLRKEIEIATVAMQKGFNIEQNREIILKNIEALRRNGISLLDKEVAVEKQIERSLKIQKATSYRDQLKDASRIELSYKKRLEATKKMRIAEKQLLTDAKAGIGVEELHNNLLKVRNQAYKEGAYLSEIQIKNLKLANMEQEKMSKRGGFLTKEWFKQRAGWFLQLRLFWELYRKAGEAARDLVEFETQLSRALRTARSNFKSHNEIVKDYIKIMQQAAGPHAASWEQLGEALYQLGSAGLEAEEVLAALNSTMSLIIGTEGDVRETTKAVAGVFNNFKDSLKGFNTVQEKFEYINSIIAAAWRDNQVELSELTDGYKRASGVAKVMGVSFRDLTAILAVLNNHMIKGGPAGRGLVSIWNRMTKESKKFRDVFRLTNEEFDSHKPLDFIKVMDKVSERLKEGTLTVAQLGDMFQRVGVRGGPQMATLVKAWDEVRESMTKLDEQSKVYADIEKERLDNLEGQWKKLVRYMATAVTRGKVLYDLAEGILKTLNKVASGETERFAEQLRKQRFEKDIKNAKENINKFNTEIEKAEEKFKNATNSITKLFIKQEIKNLKAGLFYWEQYLKKKEEELYKSNKILGNIFPVPDKNKVAKDQKEYIDSWRKNLKPQPYTFIAEEEFKRALIREDDIKNIRELRKEVDVAKDDFHTLWAEEEKAKKTGIDTATGWDEVNKAHKKYLQLRKDLESTENKINTASKKELSGQLSLYKEQAQTQIRSIDAEIKRLSIGAGVLKNAEEITGLQNERLILENNIAEIEASQNRVANKTNEIVEETLRLRKEENTEEDKGLRVRTALAQLQIKLNRLAAEYNEKLDKQKQAIAIAKINHASQLKITELELEGLHIQEKHLEARKKAIEGISAEAEREKQLAAINREILQLHTDILEKQEEYARNSSIIYDWTQRVKDGLKEWHEVATDALATFTEGFGTGLGDVFADFTGGFQEQQQEVADLEGELRDLQKELDDAIDDADIERVKEIKDQMAELNREIDDLKDPIENIKTEFNDFFKSLIDGIRKAIAEWLAMQLVMGITKVVGNAFTNTGGFSAYEGMASLQRTATGGILPNIKAFRSFSSGGMTNRPTLALLGDNRSKQELVIPTENIKSDNVSGYMRESERPVYIINAITEEEIAQSMAKTTGEKVIVNSVIKNRGIIRRNL